MDDELETCVVLVDANQEFHVDVVDEDTALTLIATASEDPHSIDEMAGLWPRYVNPVVPEFFDAIAFRSVAPEVARQALAETDRWVVIDLLQKRICTGPAFFEIGRHQSYTMTDDDTAPQTPITIHLPPWWEFDEAVALEHVSQPRRSEIAKPVVNREVLFGDPMMDFFSRRIIETLGSDAWQSTQAADDATKEGRRDRHEFTKSLHREWLMTPRKDLGGVPPRDLLHAGREWIDGVVAGQRIRCEEGSSMVAIADDMDDYLTAPMGTEEVVVYFDLCRELIGAGWKHGLRHQSSKPQSDEDCETRHAALLRFLRDVKQLWLSSPQDGDIAPEFMLEYSRRRVPRAEGVPVVGMQTPPKIEHPNDCDCPFCEMNAVGLGFGPAFVITDGHHLELDDEFAFSLCETQQEWEEQRLDFTEID